MGRRSSAFEAVGNGFFGQAEKLLAIVIVDVNDCRVGSACSGPREEDFLGGEIVFKSFVIIHVLARQIRENRR